MLLLQHTKLNFLLFSLPPCWLPPAGENMSKSCGIFCFPNPQSHSKYPESQQSQILDGPKPLLPTQRYKAENTESSNVQLRDLSIHKRFPPTRANKQDQSSHWEGQQSPPIHGGSPQPPSCSKNPLQSSEWWGSTAGAHWAQASAEALASRTGKLKGETKRRTAAEMLDCQVLK